MDNVSGVLIRFKDQFLTFTNVPGIKIGVIDIIEILIISVLFYHIFCGFWHSELENPYFIMDDHSDRKYDPFYESTDL